MKKMFAKRWRSGRRPDSQRGSLLLEHLFATAGAVIIAAAVIPVVYDRIANYLLRFRDSISGDSVRTIINVKDGRKL